MGNYIGDHNGLIKLPTPGYEIGGREGGHGLGGAAFHGQSHGPQEISGLAMGLGPVADAASKWAGVEAKQEERQQHIDAQRAINESQDRWRDFRGNMAQMTGRAGFDAPERAKEFLKNEQKLLMGQAKGDFQKNIFESFLFHSGPHWLDTAVNHRITQQDVDEQMVWQGVMRNSFAAIDQNPAGWEGWIDGQMTLWHSMNPGAPDVSAAAKRDELRALAAKQAVSAYLVRGDYDAAAAVVDNAGLDSAATLAMRQNVDHARRARETEAKALLGSDMKDHLTGLAANGEGMPGFAERAARHLPPEQYAEIKKQEAVSLDLYQALNDPIRAYQPRSERYQELYEKYIKPIEDHVASQKPAYPGLEADHATMKGVKKAIEDDNKRFLDHPIDAIDEAAQRVLKTEYGDDAKKAVSRKHEIEIRHSLLAQQRPDMNPADMPVLTSVEAAQLKAQWDGADVRQKAALHQQWEQDYGEYLPRALAESQIGPAGYLHSLLVPVDVEMAGAVLMASGKKASDYDLDKATKDDVKAALVNASDGGWFEDASFLQIQHDLYRLRADDPVAAARYEGMNDLITKLAYEYLSRDGGRNKLTARKVVAKVSQALDSQYKFVSDLDLGQVAYPKDRNFEAAFLGMNTLKTEMGAAWDDGTFFRNAGESGLVIDRPDGQSLTVTFEEIEAVGGSAAPATTRTARTALFASRRLNENRNQTQNSRERARALLADLEQRQEKDQWAGFEAMTSRTVERLEKEKAQRPLAEDPRGQEADQGRDYNRIYGDTSWLPLAFQDRAAPYVDMVAAASEEYGVPREMIAAVIATESKWKSSAVSPTGVRGLMQVTDATYKSLGFSGDRAIPENSIRAGTKLLARLYQKYGNWPDALRDYNGGPDGVSGAKKGRWGQWVGNHEKQREILNYAPTVMRHLQDITGRLA